MRIDKNGNVGIGTTFLPGAPASKLTTVGSGKFYDPSVLGAELAGSDASCTGWTFTGWTCSAGVLTHTTGNTTAATYTAAIYAGNTYRLVFTTTGANTPGVTPSVGGVAASAVTTAVTSTFDIETASTAALTFTPASTYVGSINVTTLSLKPPLAAFLSAATHRHKSIQFADLGSLTPMNGDMIYCADCSPATWNAAAAGSGTGSMLAYQNGVWLTK
jgi:hypothetical protein